MGGNSFRPTNDVRSALTLLLVLMLVTGRSGAFLFPTRAAHTLQFADGDRLSVWAGSLHSLSFWDPVLFPATRLFCTEDDHEQRPLRLEEALSGDRFVKVSFDIKMDKSKNFSALCRTTMSQTDIALLVRLIKDNYCLTLSMEGLDVVDSQAQQRNICPEGVPIGYELTSPTNGVQYAVYNHLTFNVYVDDTLDGHRIVGVTANPVSVDLSVHPNQTNCEQNKAGCTPFFLDVDAVEQGCEFSYAVMFTKVTSETIIPAVVLDTDDSGILAWIVPPLITLALALLLGRWKTALLWTCCFGLSRRQSLPAVSVIRQMRDDMTVTPRSSRLLAICVATGMHLTVATFAVLECLLLGMITSPYWTNLLQTFVGMYLSTAAVVGFHHARLDRLLHGKSELLPWHAAKLSHGDHPIWGSSALAQTVQMHAFSIFMLLVLFVCNLFRFATMAFLHVPMGTFLALIVLWTLFSLPSSIFGRLLGSQTRPLYTFWDRRVIWTLFVIAIILWMTGLLLHALLILPPLFTLHFTLGSHVVPCKERRVVVTPWHVTSTAPMSSGCDWLTVSVALMIVGVIPFTTIMFEVWMVLDALLGQSVYISFWRLALVFCCFMVSCVLTSWLVVVFSVARKDNSSLSWKAFLTAGASGIYLFVFCVVYFLHYSKLALSPTNAISFLSFAFIVCLSVSLMAGAIGFFVSQTYIFRLFQSFGTIVAGDIGGGPGEERFLTLNGVRFDSQPTV